MIVYTGHSVFKWVYVCNERGADLGRLYGLSPGCGPWRLQDHEQPLGVDAALQLERLGLARVEIDGNDIDGDGVFHGTPPKKLSDIDWSELFGPVPPGLHRREPTLKPKQFDEPKSKTKYRFVRELTDLIRDISEPRIRMCGKSEQIEHITGRINDLVYEYFKETP